VQAVEEAIAFVHKHSLHGAEIGTVRCKERWSLPPVAVRSDILRGKTAGQHSDADIHVPPMFFKIVVLEDPDPDVEVPIVLAFLFAHQRVRHGEIEDFLVSVDVVEALTGLECFCAGGRVGGSGYV
jgi:hypothetical protein